MTEPFTRTRALAKRGSATAAARGALYKGAYARIKLAMDSGFHLEAITLIESLLSDRLESRTSFLLGADFSFRTLEALLKKLLHVERDQSLREVVSTDVARWKNRRNLALHEMAKLADGDTRTWDDRVAELKDVSSEGLQVLRKVDRLTKTLRRIP